MVRVVVAQGLRAIHERLAGEHMTSAQEMPCQKSLLEKGDSASSPASGCLAAGVFNNQEEKGFPVALALLPSSNRAAQGLGLLTAGGLGLHCTSALNITITPRLGLYLYWTLA